MGRRRDRMITGYKASTRIRMVKICNDANLYKKYEKEMGLVWLRSFLTGAAAGIIFSLIVIGLILLEVG
jgi:hypothetical protein